MAEALRLGTAAVTGRWQSSADGAHHLLLPGTAWRALPHIIGSEAYQKDHGLGLNAAPPASVAGMRRGALLDDGGDSLDDEDVSVESDDDWTDSSSITSSSDLSAESSELTDTEAAGSSSSYEAFTDDEALRRRREQNAGGWTDLITATLQNTGLVPRASTARAVRKKPKQKRPPPQPRVEALGGGSQTQQSAPQQRQPSVVVGNDDAPVHDDNSSDDDMGSEQDAAAAAASATAAAQSSRQQARPRSYTVSFSDLFSVPSSVADGDSTEPLLPGGEEDRGTRRTVTPPAVADAAAARPAVTASRQPALGVGVVPIPGATHAGRGSSSLLLEDSDEEQPQRAPAVQRPTIVEALVPAPALKPKLAAQPAAVPAPLPAAKPVVQKSSSLLFDDSDDDEPAAPAFAAYGVKAKGSALFEEPAAAPASKISMPESIGPPHPAVVQPLPSARAMPPPPSRPPKSILEEESDKDKPAPSAITRPATSLPPAPVPPRVVSAPKKGLFDDDDDDGGTLGLKPASTPKAAPVPSPATAVADAVPEDAPATTASRAKGAARRPPSKLGGTQPQPTTALPAPVAPVAAAPKSSKGPSLFADDEDDDDSLFGETKKAAQSTSAAQSAAARRKALFDDSD